ncbi:MAG: hypothetical protein HYV09_30545 [Deltaproteobacteria bacterium]|nr:hypothetical protein [Deltaproteobacteria bacterium]
MTLHLILLAIALTGVSGLLALLVPRAHGARVATATLLVGATAGAAGAVLALRGEAVRRAWPWAVPGGALSFRVDGLAAMFLLQIFVIAALGAIYGVGYFSDEQQPQHARKVRAFYGLTTAGMSLLVASANAVLFLVGWEVMALAAFMLVSTDDEDPVARHAGLVYLLSTRVGTLCLIAYFALLRSVTGSFSLDVAALDAARPVSTALFALALAAFGLKAGVMPLHIWLPGAHANAPSHVSALMSGVLIKMGIYGIVRAVSLFVAPPVWWGGLVLSLGIASAVLGVLFAIGQHDLKRLLAYHSVENIGIILMGLGVAMLGRAFGDETLFVLGAAGALLHTWNHGIFKALLFLSAGSAVHAAGTREIDRLGGLSKKMPATAGAFAVGAIAICGLPPLNGFVSELLVYLGLARACAATPGPLFAAGAIGAPALALVGALAVACFVKAYGAVFLGEPRTEAARHVHESGPAMLGPMATLAVLCVLIGVGPVLVAPALDRALVSIGGSGAPVRSAAPLSLLTWIGAPLLFVIAIGVIWAYRRRVASRAQPTWDCGYAAGTARMQYTSSSFAEIIVGLFSTVLRPERSAPKIDALFPAASHFHSHVPEVVLDRAIAPTFRVTGRALASLRWMQRGSVHLYVVYVFAALVLALLVFR